MDETGILQSFFVLLDLHFCFLLGHHFSRAKKAASWVWASQAAEKLYSASCVTGHDFSRAKKAAS
jgi:hypothetical protein